MAYKNFNTNTKFWAHLQVEGLNPSTNPDASAYLAYNTNTNNGLISVFDASVSDLRWKPIIHHVVGVTSGETPSVTINGGVATVDFSKNWGGGEGGDTIINYDCSTYKIVANINNTAGTSTQLAVRLPRPFDFTNSFLMTTVYIINDKGIIEGESEPQVDIIDRNEGEGSESVLASFVRFTFGSLEEAQKRFKVMILFDKDISEHHIVTDQVIIGNITPGSDGWNSNDSRPAVNGKVPEEYREKNVGNN